MKFFPNTKILKIVSPIRVRELNSVIYNIDKFITIITYTDNELSNDTLAVAKIIIKVYLVNNLKANILIDNDILVS